MFWTAPAATPYVGHETLKKHFRFYTYGPASPAVLRLTWWVRVRLALAAWLSGLFVWTGPLDENGINWRASWRGDCVSYAFLVRGLCGLFGLPEGAFRLCFVTTGAAPNGGTADGHMTLHAVTDAGDFAIECGKKEWRPWDAYGHHDHNREALGD